MDRLKPCPFCGSKDIKLCGNHRDSFWFRCNKCASIDSYDTERQAVRAWNKRVAIPSAYKGMKNGEVITKILKDAEWAELTSDIGLAQEDTIYIKVGGYWWNSPYEPQEAR